MSGLPISTFTSTGFYFSGTLFFLSAFLLAALYRFRWKSNFAFLALWLTAFAISGIVSWLVDKSLFDVALVAILNVFLAICFHRLAYKISFFGVFFLAGLTSPSFFGLIWLYEILDAASTYLNSGWLINSLLILIGAIFSVLIIVNTVMLSGIQIVRYSPLYFRFPRVKKGWKKASEARKKNPWVSIHIPCYNEPPEIVISTLNALAHLDYSSFEVIVLDNNTKDPNIWKPIEKHCRSLGKHFHFYHIDSLSGAKAGALNACLQLTSPQAEIIGVMDADYLAEPDFLSKLAPFFDDEQIGFVQACQDYHSWRGNTYQTACYFEYEVHFKMELGGMNEWDTSYTVGTMCLLRKKAIEEAGGWAEWCLTEDSEIAVRLHALGYPGHYLIDSFGYGLIPETFEGYKQQRFRWTAGANQQIQKHWRLYLPWHSKGNLTLTQKFAEISHSLSIFFREFLSFIINIPILILCLWFTIAKEQSFYIPYPILLLIPASIIRDVISNLIAVSILGKTGKIIFWQRLHPDL